MPWQKAMRTGSLRSFVVSCRRARPPIAQRWKGSNAKRPGASASIAVPTSHARRRITGVAVIPRSSIAAFPKISSLPVVKGASWGSGRPRGRLHTDDPPRTMKASMPWSPPPDPAVVQQRRRLEQALDRAVPDWRRRNQDPWWHAWLAMTHLYSEASRGWHLDAAAVRGDA